MCCRFSSRPASPDTPSPSASVPLARREHQVVEERRRESWLEQRGVEALEGEVAAEREPAPAVGDLARGRRVPSSVRTVHPKRLARSSSPRILTSSNPASRKIRSSVPGAKACTSTSRSSWCPSSCSASSARRAGSSEQQPPQRRHELSAALRQPRRAGLRSGTARRRTPASRPVAAPAGTRPARWVDRAGDVAPRVRTRGRSSRPRTAGARRRSPRSPPRAPGARRWRPARRASRARCRSRPARPISPSCRG